ncbi:MAPEG family protein [Rhodoblastus acidophilus]|uniref:MAPEG family protein n=1 Tax=Rhodoblastus acidophilus TaxID=1074 RepID=A0A6N8DNH1_RHOAC|nr:MAPEG family protein [Rhodoblastus acidophilus]MCW2275704.1 glutathione S-transferase [Rhodoblastus acidophilus]MTV31868.1 MAPEG family protein [Rhodoblastus acidophilus]
MFYLTALTTLATVQFYGWLGYRVGRARMIYGVPAPATTGDPTFERHYRIQMNTLEWLPIQLVGLWMFAIYVSDLGAALLGVVWIVGRALYARAYLADPKTRTTGFVIQFAASTLLCLGAIGDIFMRILLGD